MLQDGLILMMNLVPHRQYNLDEEAGIPSLRTLGVRCVQAKNRGMGNNTSQCRFRRVKKYVQVSTYDSYIACHCEYMAKIVQDVDPTCFDDTIGNARQEKSMDEEMATLDANETWIWYLCLNTRM